MPFRVNTILAEPRVEGFDRNDGDDGDDGYVANAVSSITDIERDPDNFYVQAEKLGQQVLNEHFREIVNPPPAEELSDQARRNREILAWALNKGILDIPREYRTAEGYSKAETRDLLEFLDKDQLRKLQGDLAYNLLQHRKDCPRKNTCAFGGIVYSQEQISDPEDPMLDRIVARVAAVPGRFDEGGGPIEEIKDFFNNVRGTIHCIPWGVPHEIPGKGKETLFMIADDLIELINAMQDGRLHTPRFILGTTGKKMAEATKRHAGAQIAPVKGYGSILVESILEGPGGVHTNADTWQIFLTDDMLEEAKERAIRTKAGLYMALEGDGEKTPEELLAEIRRDAINYMLCGELS